LVKINKGKKRREEKRRKKGGQVATCGTLPPQMNEVI